MKKILVTGAGGFVGSRVVQQWAGRYELCTFPKGFLATAREDAVRQAVLQQRPDGILHTAAISDTGYCADHPEQAYRANVELPVWLARAAAETGAKLVAFSSDQVYAGVEQSGPLPETIPLKPANVYGQDKLEMEQRVQALCPGAVLLRATWMYDLPGYRLPIRNRQISRRIKKHLWLSNRSWARDVHSFGILHSWGALAGKSCSAQASSIWLIAGAFRRTQSK